MEEERLNVPLKARSGGSSCPRRSASQHFFPDSRCFALFAWDCAEKKAEHFYDHLTIVQLMLQHALFFLLASHEEGTERWYNEKNVMWSLSSVLLFFIELGLCNLWVCSEFASWKSFDFAASDMAMLSSIKKTFNVRIKVDVKKRKMIFFFPPESLQSLR